MEVPIPVCVVILFPAQWQEHLWGRRYWTINHEETLESIYLSTENDDRKANDEDTLQHIADGVWEGGHPLQCVCSNLDEQVRFFLVSIGYMNERMTNYRHKYAQSASMKS